MALKGSENVTIAGATDKINITATFAITLSGTFLPMQLMYRRRPCRVFLDFNF